MSDIGISVDTTELNNILQGFPVRKDRAMHDLMSDIATRSKSWVAQEIAGLYNIKKSDVSGGAVTIRIHTEPEKAELDYNGRLLTPTHYRMGPKAPTKSSYTLKVGNYKGASKPVGKWTKKKVKGGPHSKKSGWILMPLNGQDAAYIPAQRVAPGHHGKVEVMRGPAIPEIITSEHAQAKVEERLAKEVEKRAAHHLERAFND